MFRSVLLCAFVAVAACAAPRVRPLVPMLDGRIVGGVAVNIEDYPYQISLQSYGGHICGGSIIDEETIVTAAHCTSGSLTNTLSVRAGSTILQQGGQELKIKEVRQHVKFSLSTLDFDVSVLKLASPLKLGQGVQKIAIQQVNAEVAGGTTSTVSGWGTTSSGGNTPLNLRAVDVPIVDRKDCNVAYDGIISDRMICAGLEEGGKDSCQGDSGGPLVANGHLVGIVSWGYGCAKPNYPGVYTNVADKNIHDHITSSFNETHVLQV